MAGKSVNIVGMPLWWSPGAFWLTWFNYTYISNYMPIKMWNEITYPFPNFNGCTVEVWKGISNFLPHFIMDVITYQFGD